MSYRFLERPIRTGALLHGGRAQLAAPVGIVAMALCGFLVTSTLSTPTHLDFAAAAEEVNVGQARAPKLTPVQVPLGVEAPPTVAFFGDSTGLITAKGFKAWAASASDVQMVGGAAWYGCGIVREGRARFNGKEFDPGACGNLVEQWGQALDVVHPAIGVIQVGPIDVDDHLLPGDSEWRAPGDPVFDAILKERMLEAVDVFLVARRHADLADEPVHRAVEVDATSERGPLGRPGADDPVQPAAPAGAAGAAGPPGHRPGALDAAPTRWRVRPGPAARRCALRRAGVGGGRRTVARSFHRARVRGGAPDPSLTRPRVHAGGRDRKISCCVPGGEQPPVG